MTIGTENPISKLRSNSDRICLSSLRTNTFEKGLNSFFLLPVTKSTCSIQWENFAPDIYCSYREHQ